MYQSFGYHHIYPVITPLIVSRPFTVNQRVAVKRSHPYPAPGYIHTTVQAIRHSPPQVPYFSFCFLPLLKNSEPSYLVASAVCDELDFSDDSDDLSSVPKDADLVVSKSVSVNSGTSGSTCAKSEKSRWEVIKELEKEILKAESKRTLLYLRLNEQKLELADLIARRATRY